MSRLDHAAWRTKDKEATSKFFIDAFGYKIQSEFTIYFDEAKTQTANCVALEPPEKIDKNLPWKMLHMEQEYHLAPEIFVSSGSPGSIVDEWLNEKGVFAALHHIAYQVDSVEKTMQEWKDKGWLDFSSEKPFHCDDLTQIFTVPHKLTGITYEFIERGEHGFCAENVRNLMKSQGKT